MIPFNAIVHLFDLLMSIPLQLSGIWSFFEIPPKGRVYNTEEKNKNNSLLPSE